MPIVQRDFDTLRQLEESLWRSETRSDREYMNRVLSPDFFEFGRSGRIYSREEILAMPPEEIHAVLPLKNFDVHLIDANVALVTYVSEVRHERVETANRSSLWVKTRRGWQLRFHQGTPATR